MTKKIIILFFVFFTFFQITFANEGKEPILYYGQGCPHCGQVEKFIKENNLEGKIIQKEIYQNSKNAEEFNLLCEQEGIGLMDRGVPFLYAGNECFIGDKQIVGYLENKDKKTEATKETKESFSRDLTIPVLIGASLVDAINPCAFAVLFILMTTVLASGQRKRALFSGLAFTLSIFISYFLMGLGFYSIIAGVKTSQIFMKIIGIIAILLGIFNLKDFFWYNKGFLMEVPMSWRPKLKGLIHSITNPIGAFLTGFVVSLFLLPCTSGPYIIIIGMLGHKTSYFKAIWLLVLYNLIFVLPMVGITLGAYFGMNIKKAEEKRSNNLKILHLIAGIIMLGMGVCLLFGII